MKTFLLTIYNFLYSVLPLNGKRQLYKTFSIWKNNKEAKHLFSIERPHNGSYKDYVLANKKQQVSYDEYMYCYEFWKLNEEQRSTFISQSEMVFFNKFIVVDEFKKYFWVKKLFLEQFSKFVHRKWIEVNSSSFEQFSTLLNSSDCIIKPQESSGGNGIFITKKGEEKNLEDLYEKCKQQNCLVEEWIVGCDEIQSFHPSSLNTIRLWTIHGEKGTEVFHAFLRTGRNGSVIDNSTGNVGIRATIDVDTGIIISDAFSKKNERYEEHPDTHVKFKGFTIPKFEEVKKACIEAANVFPHPIVGWDVVIRNDGRIEFVEGNHMPDIYGIQQLLKIGQRKNLKEALERCTNFKFDN